MVEDEPSSLLRQESLNPDTIHSVRVLEPGKVRSDQLGLIGESQGRSVIIEGIDIEITPDEGSIPVLSRSTEESDLPLIKRREKERKGEKRKRIKSQSFIFYCSFKPFLPFLPRFSF